jgi:hypothetical protein
VVLAFHSGGLAEHLFALWFGALALLIVFLAASCTVGVAWLAVPFCLGAALAAGYAWFMLRAGWGLYAVVAGGILGAAMATFLAITDTPSN